MLKYFGDMVKSLLEAINENKSGVFNFLQMPKKSMPIKKVKTRDLKIPSDINF